ncbi:MAG TPA: DUF5667 domain-containing protein [Candidatus Limnocylindria bacterium]|nr:DUF5667 domain-containing protein [Candidatus Limnocylindria bacterium]
MLPRPEPRDAFRRALRAQLMAQAPGVLARRETTWSRVHRSLLKPAVAFAAVALILVAGATKAAADSLPGDAAFGLKLAAEQLQLALALDDTTRLRLLSEQADHRLAELAVAVAARPAAAPTATEEYAAAVTRFTAAVDALRGQAGTSEDTRTLAQDVVDAAHQKHEAVIEALEKTAPAGAQQGLERAKEEADKLHASDRPARTADPSGRPDRARSPQPTRTLEPSRSPEPTDGGDQRHQPAGSARPSRTPEPTHRPGDAQERSSSPAPADDH